MVGAGNLSRALLRYRGFRERGFRVDGIVDIDPKLLGKEIEGLVISPLTLIPKLVKERGIEIGILAVPAEAAQSVADSLVTAGIKGLLNFAPVVLRLPNEVKIVNVDLTIQLEQLAFQIQMGLDSEQ
jgi:redox-sensing transcriptional repressor